MELPQYKPVEPAAEIERFRQCHGAAIQETREMLEKARAGQNGDAEGILDAQLTLLMDEYAVVEPIEEAIVQEGLNLFQAAGQVFEEIAETFRQADDEYMSQRAADVEDICGRFLSRGLGLGRQEPDAVRHNRNGSGACCGDYYGAWGVLLSCGYYYQEPWNSVGQRPGGNCFPAPGGRRGAGRR